jgi:hypothetical protein
MGQKSKWIENSCRRSCEAATSTSHPGPSWCQCVSVCGCAINIIKGVPGRLSVRVNGTRTEDTPGLTSMFGGDASLHTHPSDVNVGRPDMSTGATSGQKLVHTYIHKYYRLSVPIHVLASEKWWHAGSHLLRTIRAHT